VSWVRLRQVALVAADLEAVVGELATAFGLQVAYRDPAVATFGLHNAVLPVGHQFIEVVSPLPGREGTAAGRQLERAGGDGGYMVICHTDDQDAVRARMAEAGVRAAFEHDDDGYRILQLHPGDTGGSFLEVDFHPGAEDPDGPWPPAGPDWQSAVNTRVVRRIAGVTVQSRDPSGTGRRWASLLGADYSDGAVELDNAWVRFTAGDFEGLTEVIVQGPPPGARWPIGGVTFSSS
jgi:hypothetical protein